MSTNSLMPQVKTVNEDLPTKVRNLVAQYLGVNNKRVSDEARFRKDLGADWLDRLELMIMIEDQFGVEIPDGVVDQLEAVGDLIRFVEAQPRH
jgi:acyl carrier protein